MAAISLIRHHPQGKGSKTIDGSPHRHASSSIRPRPLRRSLWSTRPRRGAPVSVLSDMSAGMLEGIAKLALRSQLRSFEAIDVKVNASAARVMQGVLEGAVVRGIGWESPLGLSARLLEVQVGTAEVDIARTMQTQNIQLSNVPTGTGRVRFTEQDFSNFLAHPLMLSAASTAVQQLPFNFDANKVSLLVQKEHCCLKFAGTWTGDGHSYSGALTPQRDGGVLVTCTSDEPTADTSLVGRELTSFFGSLTVELDGVFLTFGNLRLAIAAKSGQAVIDLQVSARVESFPSLSQLKF